jgi:adenylate cyclase
MPRIPRLTPTLPSVRVLVALGIGLGVGLVLLGLRETGLVGGLERRLVDVRTKAHLGSREADPRIVLAVVQNEDADALKESGNLWPWDLSLNAYAFRWMAACGVRAVVVDVLHFDKGSGPEELDPDNANSAAIGSGWGGEADILAKAYREVGHVVLGYELVGPTDRQTPWAVKERLPEFERHADRLPRIDTRTVLVKDHANLPVVRLLRAAGGVGYVNSESDGDGVIRRTRPVALVGERRVPSLMLAAAMQVTRGRVELGERELRLGDSVQHLDADGAFLLNFRGRRDAYSRVRPSHMVLAGAKLEEMLADAKADKLPPGTEPPTVQTAIPEAVRGKIVIWGINLGGQKDIVASPVDDSMPGPEYQATILDNLLHGDGRVYVSPWVNTLILMVGVLVIGLMGGMQLPRGVYAGASFVILVGTLAMGWTLFDRGIVLDMFVPSLGFVGTFAGVMGFRVLTEGVRNRWLEGTFGKYLSPSVIAALKEDPGLIQLGGHRVEISVLFSDIAGFTGISEKLKAEDLVRLLNRYLTRQSAEVLAEEGVIDKFIGDAVMAFFGEPIPHSDHAVRACRAAVRSIAALPDLEPLTRERGLPPLLNRIGVNSGPAIVGNMGSDARFDYTAMGDTVNLASRLESANKVFGSRILIGPVTYTQAKASILAKPLARLQVVGKSKPMQVYELVGIRGEAPDVLAEHVAAYERAHAALLADDLEGAKRELGEAEKAKPRDVATSWLRGVIAQVSDGAIPRPWDGILVLESK